MFKHGFLPFSYSRMSGSYLEGVTYYHVVFDKKFGQINDNDRFETLKIINNNKIIGFINGEFIEVDFKITPVEKQLSYNEVKGKTGVYKIVGVDDSYIINLRNSDNLLYYSEAGNDKELMHSSEYVWKDYKFIKTNKTFSFSIS